MQMIKNSLYKNSSVRILLSLLSVLLFVYIILFEFILPVNQILPKPSVLSESIPVLLSDKGFINSYFYTLSIVYLIFISSYFLIKLFFPIFFRFSISFPNLISAIKSIEYIFPLLLILVFNFWFGNSNVGEVFFAFIIVMALLKITVLENLTKIKDEYYVSSVSLGLNKNEVVNKVIWRSVQPNVFKVLQKNHFLIWTYIIIYEFINRTDGIGNSIFQLIKYKDFVFLILVLITVIVSLFIFSLLMNKIKSKYFFWEQ